MACVRLLPVLTATLALTGPSIRDWLTGPVDFNPEACLASPTSWFRRIAYAAYPYDILREDPMSDAAMAYADRCRCGHAQRMAQDGAAGRERTTR